MFFFFFVVNFVRCEYKAICSMARANFKFSIKEIVSRKHGLVSYIDKSTCYCLCFAKICVKTKWISMHITLPWLQRHIYRVRRFLPSVSCVSIRVILLSLTLLWLFHPPRWIRTFFHTPLQQCGFWRHAAHILPYEQQKKHIDSEQIDSSTGFSESTNGMP